MITKFKNGYNYRKIRRLKGMNKVLLVGRLARDAELINTGDGERQGLRFVLAVDRNYKNSEGEREADFISITYWNNYADKFVTFLPKGRLISITGRLSVKSYVGADNVKRYFTNVLAENIQFLDSKKKEEEVV